MSLIKQFIEKAAAQKSSIAVVGDAMIDEYYYVEATRVSPEFPIPVMRSLGEKPSVCLPGGAANVAYQFKHWNTRTVLHAPLDNRAVSSFWGVVEVPDYASSLDFTQNGIPIKRRIYDGKHPAFRWDIERPFYGVSDVELSKVQDYVRYIYDRIWQDTQPQAMILSDYHKGTFATHTSLGLEARQRWIRNAPYPTIVDPKFGPLEGWKGCTIFKPNKKEAEELSGLKDWQAQCLFFLDQLECKHVVITQGADGVVGMSRVDHDPWEYQPNFKVDAKSVIGAGDCFVTFLTLAYILGFSIEEAAEIAYKAGAVYVQRGCNQPVTSHELLAFEDPIAAKCLPPPAKRDFKLGFTNGCFDLLHAGHLESLLFAKKHCDKLMVAVNSDESVKRLKCPEPSSTPRPHIPLVDRMRLLAGLECVDYVVSFEEDTPYNVINLHRPDVIVKGEDYRDKEVVGADLVKEVVFAPLLPGRSTSMIQESIQVWA